MSAIDLAVGFLLTAFLIFLLSLYRLQTILDPRRAKARRRRSDDAQKPTHVLVVLGSGGHTAEMIAMLERAVTDQDPKMRLNWRDFSRRTWVISSGDTISIERAKRFEEMFAPVAGGTEGVADPKAGTYTIQVVPRARAIHQPLFTAPISSLNCLFACIEILTYQHAITNPGGLRDFPDVIPDVILCNGPATAAIMVFASVLLRFFNIRRCNSRGKMRTIYVESWARVKKLSLSGKLLSRVCDRFLVQWEQLEKQGGRAEYIGVLV